MKQTFEIEGLRCLCCSAGSGRRIAYILYPMDMLADWVEPAAKRYGVDIVVVTGMDWESVFSPWPAPGVPKGSPDFKGRSPEFLRLLQAKVIPQVEERIGCGEGVERTLVGVSMSGLFALWQWMVCDTFANIASLSGSFWYEGFVGWIESRPVPSKQGRAFFLLGDQEAKSKVKAFATVADATSAIIAHLRRGGIDATFESVPGNHYSDPLPRLDRAFTAFFCPGTAR